MQVDRAGRARDFSPSVGLAEESPTPALETDAAAVEPWEQKDRVYDSRTGLDTVL